MIAFAFWSARNARASSADWRKGGRDDRLIVEAIGLVTVFLLAAAISRAVSDATVAPNAGKSSAPARSTPEYFLAALSPVEKLIGVPSSELRKQITQGGLYSKLERLIISSNRFIAPFGPYP